MDVRSAGREQLLRLADAAQDVLPDRDQAQVAIAESVATVGALVEAMLVALIPAAIKRLRVREPAYALLLAHDDEGNDMFPPHLALGLVSTRAAWAAAGEASLPWMIWNPADHEPFPGGLIELEEPKLLAACERLNQLIATSGKLAAGRKLLERVARVEATGGLPDRDGEAAAMEFHCLKGWTPEKLSDWLGARGFEVTHTGGNSTGFLWARRRPGIE